MVGIKFIIYFLKVKGILKEWPKYSQNFGKEISNFIAHKNVFR